MNTTWACNNKEAKPAPTPTSIEINNKLNFMTPKNIPIPKTFQIDVLGKGIKNTVGIATMAKRKAENNTGGISSRPTLITVKFAPK